MTTPPPPTVLARIDAPQAIVDRLTNLWRLATDDNQRWEIERLAEDIDQRAYFTIEVWG